MRWQGEGWFECKCIWVYLVSVNLATSPQVPDSSTNVRVYQGLPMIGCGCSEIRFV